MIFLIHHEPNKCRARQLLVFVLTESAWHGLYKKFLTEGYIVRQDTIKVTPVDNFSETKLIKELLDILKCFN